MGHRVFRAKKISANIDGIGRIPVLDVEFTYGPRKLHSGVLDQHIQPAQPVHGLRDQRFDGLRQQAIKANKPYRATQRSSNRGPRFLVNVRHDNFGAFLYKCLCRCAPDAGRPSGDDAPFPQQTLHAVLPWFGRDAHLWEPVPSQWPPTKSSFFLSPDGCSRNRGDISGFAHCVCRSSIDLLRRIRCPDRRSSPRRPDCPEARRGAKGRCPEARRDKPRTGTVTPEG